MMMTSASIDDHLAAARRPTIRGGPDLRLATLATPRAMPAWISLVPGDISVGATRSPRDRRALTLDALPEGA
jgi:hypothetical protein